MNQLEIPIPIQPPRVTLGQARALRDDLERKLRERNARFEDGVDGMILAVALQFHGADIVFHSLHSGIDHRTSTRGQTINFTGKHALEQLHELGRFIQALEQKKTLQPFNASTDHNGAH
jgi:hypothetical protein